MPSEIVDRASSQSDGPQLTILILPTVTLKFQPSTHVAVDVVNRSKAAVALAAISLFGNQPWLP
jgi:hypothetical protein